MLAKTEIQTHVHAVFEFPPVTDTHSGEYRVPVSYTHLDVYKRQVFMLFENL